ncbi:MAG: ISL3 family transposase [Bacteroidales bacterium]|nr:ISL3 family transposase [Bacteroidales bacterium]
MCKVPNEGKFTTFLRRCLTPPSAKADLSAFYSPSELSIEQVEFEDTDTGTYHVYAQCNLPHGVCPYCGCVSHSVHSRYFRTITDLSILGHPVIITFKARKFFCHNPACGKKTFAEQPGDEVFRYRRRTRRCEMAVTQHGLKSSSESASKMLSAIGVCISGDTVLRDIHRMSVPERCEVKEIGVDDWAFRKGVTYGSIVVSLETGAVIDLLGDRKVSSFQSWLDTHPQVKVVSRDRSTDYTAAIAATGRNITEVADRFHLVKNMSDCVTKVIGSHYQEYRSTVRAAEAQETTKVDSRQVMFDEVKDLQAEGFNIAQISKKLGIARQTVRKYMGWDTLPERASKERLPYFLYDSYVEEEYRHGKDLFKIFLEIREEGFPGSLTPFYDHYRYLSDGHRGSRPRQEVEKMKNAPSSESEPLLPIRQIAHIVDKSIGKKKMGPSEATLVEKMMSYGWFRDIYNAASSFYETIMGDDIDDLDAWLENYGKSPIKELRSFAYGISIDIKAVRNAISLDTSNGIVEGFVNKLKAIKRLMYGRASLDLLKRKMVFSNLCFN